jgi:hypothetical protein
LSEVGVDRRVEGQVGRDSVFHVHPGAAEEAAAVVEWIAGGVGRVERAASERVRQRFEPTWCRDVAQAEQMGESGGVPRLVLRDEHQLALLAFPEHPPKHLKSPQLILAMGESQL